MNQQNPEVRTEGGAAIDAAVIVAMGSNLPRQGSSPVEVLEAALACLSTHGLAVVKRSRWWSSVAWPDPSEPPFVNGAVWLVARGSPEATLRRLQSIEAAFGRVRAHANAPRPLDLDLIAFGRSRLQSPALQLPHPRAAERAFVMGPICDLDPAWRHPISGQTAARLLAAATVGADARPIEPPEASIVQNGVQEAR